MSTQHTDNPTGAAPLARRRAGASDHRVDGRDQRGATLVEYALLVALIALTAVGGITAFGIGRDGVFDRSATAIASAVERD